MVALRPQASLELGRRLLDESLPWSFADGALVLVLAPSVEEDVLENPDAVSIDVHGNLNVQFVLIRRAPDSGEILDVHEQTLLLVPNFALHGEARVRSYLRGHDLALERCVSVVLPEPHLPAQFVFPAILADSSLRTSEDFARALTALERLGSMK